MEEMKEKSDITKINVDYPDGGSPFLRLSVGACRLNGVGGEGGAWVSGTYHDPTHSLPAEIIQEGDSVKITQKQRWGVILGWLSGAPEFDLAFGKARPYRMLLESGASELDLDLGGVPLNGLEVRHGAGKIEIDFSEPNPQEMSMLSLGTGAGSVVVKNIANANMAEMALEGGAASYTLDFGGKLQRQRPRQNFDRCFLGDSPYSGDDIYQALFRLHSGGVQHGRELRKERRQLFDGRRP
jgi:hypothetical protein